MKTLIFSDTHFSTKVDSWLPLLKDLIKKYDQVIINGDFFERFLCTFDEFINSGWNELFPLLKERNTIYIYGNHDKKEFSDEKVSLFSNIQADYYNLEIGNGENLFITHGHKYAKGFDELIPFILKNWYFAAPFFYGGNLVFRSGLISKTSLRNIKNNETEKNYNSYEDYVNEKQTLVFGHTHFPYYSKNKKFLNSGMIRWNYFSYIEIIDNEINLITNY